MLSSVTPDLLSEVRAASQARHDADLAWRTLITAAVKAGLPVTQIARAANISRNAVYAIVNGAGR